MNDMGLGVLNGPAISIIMKELVRRAMATIRREKGHFVAHAKMGKGGQMDDVFTTADTAAQTIIVKSLLECFPEFGLVAEENGLTRLSTHPTKNLFFTVDPLDGTKAFVRKQGHGVGSMMALVCDGVVIAAVIGDVHTQEIFAFRPGSNKVHRISELDIAETLQFDWAKPLREYYALIRDPLADFSKPAQQLIGKAKSHLIDSGSIGLSMAKLWIGECGMAILSPCLQTPWDLAPVYGISRMMGFEFFLIDPENGELTPFAPLITQEKFHTHQEILVIHGEHVHMLPILLF